MGARVMAQLLKVRNLDDSGAAVVAAENDQRVLSEIITIKSLENSFEPVVGFHDEVGVTAKSAFSLPSFGRNDWRVG